MIRPLSILFFKLIFLHYAVNMSFYFSHNAALGFIKLWGLPLTTQAQVQLLPSIGVEGNLLKGIELKGIE